MPTTWKIISECINRNDVFVTNKDIWLVKTVDNGEDWWKRETQQLDNADAWNEYVKINAKKYMSPEALDDLDKDVALWGLPFSNPKGIFCNILDIDKGWYYISRNLDWSINHDANWKPIYLDCKTKQRIDFDKVWNKKERFLYFFTRDMKKMFIPPRWYNGFKKMCYAFIDYLNDSWWQHSININDWEKERRLSYWLLSEYWEAVVRNGIAKFFEDIESGKERSRWKKCYKIFEDWWRNQRTFLETMLWTQFSRLLSDQDFANKFFGFGANGNPIFKDYNDFRNFAEAISTYVWRKSTWHFNIIDAIWPKAAEQLYWQKILWLYDIVPGKKWEGEQIIEKENVGLLTKNKFSKLSYDQQIKQLESMGVFEDFNTTWFKQKMKIWFHYTPWSLILKLVNLVGNPSLYAWLLSFGTWFLWVVPLLILNSTMFATEKLSMWTRLDWDRKTFLRNNWLWEWFDSIDWFQRWIGNTLTDTSIRVYRFLKDVVEQWAFNIWDMLMTDSYKIRLYQQYFETYFPGIKSLSELEEKFQIMKNIEWESKNPSSLTKYNYLNWYTNFEQFMNNAKTWVDQMMRNSTTNTELRRINVGTSYTVKPINQPMLDTFYSLFHFFSWWWFAKLRWAWNVIKNALTTPYRDASWWAVWLDNLVGNRIWMDVSYRKWYLYNQELQYFIHKIHSAYIISKYLQRMSVDRQERDENTIFDNFSEMFEYFKLFNWEIAAFESTPEGRMMEIFFSNFFGQLENDAWLWTATVWATLPTVKEFLRRMFRKTYIPLIATEYFTILDRDWDQEEHNFWDPLVKSINDNCNGFLYYLDDKLENWDFDYYIPKWPNSLINSFLWVQDREKAFAQEQQNLAKYAMMMSTEWAFTNWALWNFPYFKQWQIGHTPEEIWFANDMDKFRATKAYQAFSNNLYPADMMNDDWTYIYNIMVERVWRDSAIDRDTLHASYTYDFENEDKERVQWTYKERQIQEDIVHYLMNQWLSKDSAQKFSEIMKNYKDEYVDEATRTLAYIEAKKPGSWMQVLSYIMNSEWLRLTYWNKPKDRTKEQIQKDSDAAKIAVAKKYAKFIPEADRYYTFPQIVLRYAKTHNTDIAKYIYVKDESIQSKGWKNNFIIPGTEKDPDWPTYKSTYKQNFAAQLMVDIVWAQGNPDARKLKNGYALIFKNDSYLDENGNPRPDYAAYALNQVENIYNHITHLAVDGNTKRILKQWTLMFWDELFTTVTQDPELSQRADVKQMANDWVHYWYKEFKELDDIATEYAEDQLENAEYKKNWSKKKWTKTNKWVNWYGDNDWILNWWYKKKFYWFDNWYNTMKSKAYSKNYLKYRIFDWTPRDYQTDYLKYNEFVKAKNNYNNAISKGSWWSSNKKQEGKWQKKDDGVWVTTKRGKSIQFYKMEDIDKPVEYKTPRRKRRVNKWSWTKPMWSTMWKHLTPSQKKK